MENNKREKQLSTKIRITISLITLFGVLFAFNQCVVKEQRPSRKIASSKSKAPTPSDSTIDDPDEEKDLPDGLVMPPMNSPSSEVPVDVGIKNFDQINNTMSELTGVLPNDANIQRVYTEVEVQLPTDNNIRSFLPAQQVAITKLATEYCNSLVDNAALRSRIWTNLNFNSAPSTVLVGAGKDEVVTQTISHFMRGTSATSSTTITTGTGGGSTGSTTKQLSTDAFSQTLYQTTRAYCISCHRNSVQPYHASDSVTTAHDMLIDMAKVDLSNPNGSRIVQKVRGGHNCWSNCESNANTLAVQISNWKSLIPTQTSTKTSTQISTSVKEEFNLLMNDLLSGENLSDPNVTKKVIKGLCTGALSSAQVMML